MTDADLQRALTTFFGAHLMTIENRRQGNADWVAFLEETARQSVAGLRVPTVELAGGGLRVEIDGTIRQVSVVLH